MSENQEDNKPNAAGNNTAAAPPQSGSARFDARVQSRTSEILRTTPSDPMKPARRVLRGVAFTAIGLGATLYFSSPQAANQLGLSGTGESGGGKVQKISV